MYRPRAQPAWLTPRRTPAILPESHSTFERICRHVPCPLTDVAVTGIADPGTILAIKAFQAVMMNMNPPSGQVAPGSPTYYALAARPLVNRTPPPPTPFGHIGIVPPEVIEAAKASQRQWGVPASVTVAQWIVES